MAAGFGHGTYLPAALSFGPWLLALSVFKPPDWLFFSMPILYCVYSAVLSRGKSHRITLTAVLMIHYVCASFWIYRDGFEFERVKRFWNDGAFVLIGWAAVFILSNVLAFKSSSSSTRQH
jgi:hypothetical protein